MFQKYISKYYYAAMLIILVVMVLFAVLCWYVCVTAGCGRQTPAGPLDPVPRRALRRGLLPLSGAQEPAAGGGPAGVPPAGLALDRTGQDSHVTRATPTTIPTGNMANNNYI